MSTLLRRGGVLSSRTARTGKFGVLSNSKIHSNTSRCQIAAAVASSEKIGYSPPRPTSEIPGPATFPLVGSIFPLSIYKGMDKKKVHEFWFKLKARYGSIIKMTVPRIGPLVAVATPEDCETIMRTTMDNPLRPPLKSLEQVRLDAVDNYFEKKTGLITENGDEWKRVRTQVQTPMMKPKNVLNYLTQMDEVAQEFMNRIASLQETHGEMPADFQTELYKWALESVGLVALNRRLGCLDPSNTENSSSMILIKMANQMFESMNEIEIDVVAAPWKSKKPYETLMESHNEFLRVADERINQTEAELLAKKDNAGEELTLMESLLLRPGLSRKDIVTLILDMLVAGIDTTSHTIGFALYLLSRNPRVQAELQKEIDSVLGNHDGPLTANHFAQLSYLKAVVKETFRIFPLAIGTARIPDRDLVLSGYTVPKGTTVIALNMLMGRSETYFKQADKFIPERWLRTRPLGPIHPYASLPFGTGTRMCIGRRIAEQEIYSFLTRVMQRFTVDYKYEDMDIISRLVFVPSEPLKFNFTERK